MNPRWEPVTTLLCLMFLGATLFVRLQAMPFPWVLPGFAGGVVFWYAVGYFAWWIWERKYPLSLFLAVAAAAGCGIAIRQVYGV